MSSEDLSRMTNSELYIALFDIALQESPDMEFRKQIREAIFAREGPIKGDYCLSLLPP